MKKGPGIAAEALIVPKGATRRDDQFPKFTRAVTPK